MTPLQRILILAATALAAQLALPTTGLAGQFAVWPCNQATNEVFVPHSVPGISTTRASSCPMRIWSSGRSHQGQRGYFIARAPAGITIIGAYAPAATLYVKNLNNGQQYGGGFQWQGGFAPIQNGSTSWRGTRFASDYLRFQVTCELSSCSRQAVFQVGSMVLTARENRGPQIHPAESSLFNQTRGWVRGVWPITFQATDPSGVCAEWATVGGQTVYGPVARRALGAWHQCADLILSRSVDTSTFGQGSMQLILFARNAADVTSSPSRTIYVDNQSPAISLSGPTDARSTAGPQYVTASASAGPSGVAGISCSLDNGPAQWYAGATARVPVSGVGVHHLTCSSANNARDQSGAAASSPQADWTLSIREPTLSLLSFTRVHPKGKTERTKRVRFGASTTVSGWLGTNQGGALPARHVRILTAPNNGTNDFTQAATAVTRSDGSFTARLPAGPSRLIEAVFDGSPTAEPTTSNRVYITVPASITFWIRPRATHWGRTVHLTGRLRGGFIPPSGEVVVLWVRGPGGTSEVGHLYTDRNGRFGAPYTFLQGNGTETYRFWASTARESDYPYAPANSPKVTVHVSP